MPDQPAATRSAPVTLFDLDGVISRRDTMGVLVRQRLRKSPIRFAGAVPFAMLSRVLPAQSRLMSTLNRLLVGIALRGVTETEYQEMARVAAQQLARVPGNIPARAVWEIRAASAVGRTIVITGSEYQLSRFYLDAVGLRDIELLASGLAFSGPQVRLAPHNIGSAKVLRAHSAGVETSTATLYTDSASDLPLARQVAHTVLVNPSARSRRVMLRELSNVRIARWP